MTVTLEIGVYEVEEGVSVSVCVNLSNDIERNVVINLSTTFDGMFINSATSTSGKIFFFIL